MRKWDPQKLAQAFSRLSKRETEYITDVISHLADPVYGNIYQYVLSETGDEEFAAETAQKALENAVLAFARQMENGFSSFLRRVLGQRYSEAWKFLVSHSAWLPKDGAAFLKRVKEQHTMNVLDWERLESQKKFTPIDRNDTRYKIGAYLFVNLVLMNLRITKNEDRDEMKHIAVTALQTSFDKLEKQILFQSCREAEDLVIFLYDLEYQQLQRWSGRVASEKTAYHFLERSVGKDAAWETVLPDVSKAVLKRRPIKTAWQDLAADEARCRDWLIIVCENACGLDSFFRRAHHYDSGEYHKYLRSLRRHESLSEYEDFLPAPAWQPEDDEEDEEQAKRFEPVFRVYEAILKVLSEYGKDWFVQLFGLEYLSMSSPQERFRLQRELARKSGIDTPSLVKKYRREKDLFLLLVNEETGIRLDYQMLKNMKEGLRELHEKRKQKETGSGRDRQAGRALSR